MVLLIGLPAALALWLLAEPLIISLFKYGAMEERDVVMTAFSLRAYSLGLLAFMLIKVLAPGYFSRQDTKTPVTIGIKAMVANMVLNLLLIYPMQHAGLALATSLSAFANAAMLLRGLLREEVFRWQAGWSRFAFQLLAANMIMAVFLLYLTPPADQWLDWVVWDRALNLGGLCIGGAGLYLVMLWCMGLRISDLRH